MTEDPGNFIAIARTDWLVTGISNILHAVTDGTWTDDHRADMAQDWAVSTPVRFACGETAAYAEIPGVLTRMSAMRCAGCCRATGLPEGKGSPKNDPACRIILGLDAKEEGCA